MKLIPKERLRSLIVNAFDVDSVLAISELDQLEELVISTKGKVKEKTFSFERLKSLKRFASTEFDFYDENLFSCPELTYLSLYDSYRWEDVSKLAKAQGLKELYLSGGRLKSLQGIGDMRVLEELTVNRCQINSLTGIEELQNLKEFAAYDLRKLEDISVIKQMPNLVLLSFQACNKVEDFSVIGEVKNLRDLGIENKTIPTLGFLEGLSKLETLAIAGTNVLDGDLSVLYRLPALKSAGFKNKRHYNAKESEFSEAAIIERQRNNSY